MIIKKIQLGLFVLSIFVSLLVYSSTSDAYIKVYVAEGCIFCEQAEDYLKSHNIDYKSCDITKDKICFDEFKIWAFTGTPGIIVEGQRIAGFNKEELQKVLENTGYLVRK